MKEQADEQTMYWWLAINGASCATSSMALPTMVEVVPTPEQLIGFSSQAEQQAAQKMMLTASIAEIRRWGNKKVRSGEVVYIRPPKRPQPFGLAARRHSNDQTATSLDIEDKYRCVDIRNGVPDGY